MKHDVEMYKANTISIVRFEDFLVWAESPNLRDIQTLSGKCAESVNQNTTLLPNNYSVYNIIRSDHVYFSNIIIS